mmetsp:Transcript_23408/g.30547  ORF Transcript_23408/g.30547 Transcript_23408/m.30547 type:complete len:95 (+) Transcript_23408:782-1066(+)
MRFNDRLVKMTEYSLYCPKFSFGTTSYIKLGVDGGVAEEEEEKKALLAVDVRMAALWVATARRARECKAEERINMIDFVTNYSSIINKLDPVSS